jgi:hypothetical protein
MPFHFGIDTAELPLEVLLTLSYSCLLSKSKSGGQQS